ncbi:hypothetical protein IE53DRAFT_379202 [Violaceomyces palustris]|uniref:Uncharacterized protein n=1 Tax=Violaceomyces palustris TaxID=1673888 RepID=A0ACD0NZH1_9BASI|nr:hypothetical protein IE53DRAFT_379202 [Violaceomyces palustris]
MEELREIYSDRGSVRFQPHVTLIAGIKEDPGKSEQESRSEIWSKFLETLEDWRGSRTDQEEPTQPQEGVDPSKIVCRLTDVTTRGFFFQCILISIETQPDLISLNSKMRQAFSSRLASRTQAESPYFPHCSLLYSDIDSSEAERAIRIMESNHVFKRIEPDGDVDLIDFSGITSFEFQAVELWDSNGPVEDWKLLERIDL